MIANPDAPTTRASDALFVSQCNLSGLAAKLPLRWPTPPGTPPSPKHVYRSHYVYRGWDDLREAAIWTHLCDFDLCLRLIDFSGLRPVLAQRLGWTRARGWIPFDPVSLFLLHGWQITNTWSRATTLRHLRDPRYADYAQRFGFENGVFPTEGGLRYFLTALGVHAQTPQRTVSVALDDAPAVEVAVEQLNELIAQSLTLVHDAGLLSHEAWQQALVCPDGMIHDAASRLRCGSVRDTCYQPLTREHPQRPCPARAADPPRRGCACDTVACAAACRYATPRDPHARLVVYDGSNRHADNPNQPANPTPDQKKESKRRYGYRSLPLQLADPQRRTGFVLLDTFLSAPEREHVPAAALLRQVSAFYPTLHLETTAGDAAFGYAAYLRTAYDLGVKRVVDLRADASDKNSDIWVIRGYDDTGRPLCPYGYALTANGYDAERKRHKWICAEVCLTKAQPRVTVAKVHYPPHECPYQTDAHPSGRILNVGERFADGSLRLVRDQPYGTPDWERTYHRARNASETRHATFERWGLKRLPVYGQPRGKALIFQSDVWLNLTTMARLIQEATLQAGGP
jgi:hypothetical protein